MSTINTTRKQHYVQAALTNNWNNNESVGVASINNNQYLKKEKSKSVSSVFYEEYAYEILHGFDSMDSHAKKGFSTGFDNEHALKINDGEKYCKYIEDHALPVIRKIINHQNNHLILTIEEKESLCKYLVLQSMRTPGGRKKYLSQYPNIKIDKNSSNEDTFNQFIGNIMYLMVLGVYDKNGVSNQIKMENSPSKHLVNIFNSMNVYVLRLDDKNKEQFIIGDNPCVILGDKDIWGVLMPISPKNTLFLVGDIPKRLNEIHIVRCSKRLRLFELFSQVMSAQKKIVFCEKYCSINKINKDIKIFCNLKKSNEEICWSLKYDFEGVNSNHNEQGFIYFESLLNEITALYYK